MAKQQIVTYTYTDDLTGEEFSDEEITTVEFGYNGRTYVIDLGPKNATKLDEFITPFVKAARQVSKGRPSGTVSGDKKERPGILQWAKDKKLVKDDHRGRIPNKVLEAYDAEH